MNDNVFMTDDFLLNNEASRRLYHDYAEDMPIYDFHNHLSPKDMATDRQFDNMAQLWFETDHYKWRTMRGAGIEERLITGKAEDFEKFQAWAKVVPQTLCHPQYHWTHLELKKPFGITDKLLNPDTAKEIWDVCNEKLRSPEFKTRGLLSQWNVKVLCTTDDPIDTLDFHRQLNNDPDTPFHVFPTFRVDSALTLGNSKMFNEWVSRLERSAAVYITDHMTFIEAIKKRHDFFHEMGCRLSDCSILRPIHANYSNKELKQIFADLRAEKRIPAQLGIKFISWVMHEVATMNAEKGWTQQIHIGPVRNAHARMFKRIGANTGFDIMSDGDIVQPLTRFFDRLARIHRLPKTVVYNLNPKDNMALSTLLAAFNDHTIPGKMQFGPGWWFLDQKYGMQEQMKTLAVSGLLSKFVGMLTDSRSFLSFARHEYFRRILCSFLGDQVENGELPADFELVGQMVKDICFNNAEQYFQVGKDTIPKNLPGKPRDYSAPKFDGEDRPRSRRRRDRNRRPKEGRKPEVQSQNGSGASSVVEQSRNQGDVAAKKGAVAESFEEKTVAFKPDNKVNTDSNKELSSVNQMSENATVGKILEPQNTPEREDSSEERAPESARPADQPEAQIQREKEVSPKPETTESPAQKQPSDNVIKPKTDIGFNISFSVDPVGPKIDEKPDASDSHSDEKDKQTDSD